MVFAMIPGENDSIMVPIPQYHFVLRFHRTVRRRPCPSTLMRRVSGPWMWLRVAESVNEARAKVFNVSIRLVFINLKPTGASVRGMSQLIQFAYDMRLVLCADEVCQENLCNSDKAFFSARYVLNKMRAHLEYTQEIVSFHTVSKGAYGECGMRGGYMEMHNFDPAVVSQDVQDRGNQPVLQHAGRALAVSMMVQYP